MKTLKRLLGFTAILTLLFAFDSQAQTNLTPEGKPLKGRGKAMVNLTEEQKAQMKANREEAKKAKEEFRSTLSDEQKAIMDNKDLKPEERRSTLAKALSPEQKEMMKNNALVRKAAAQEFKKNLTEEQKAQMKQFGEKRKNKPAGKVKGKE